MAKKMTAKKTSDNAEPNFENALVKLEGIVHQLEDGKLPLAEALDQYEQGIKHLKTCFELLDRAEQRIELLSGVDADGNPVTEAFEEREAESLEEKAQSRSRRRSVSDSQSKRRSSSTDTSGKNNMDGSATLF